MKHQLNEFEMPRHRIAQQLQDAIKELHADLARVELWASALTSFAQPIPDYGQAKSEEIRRANGLVNGDAAKEV